MAGIKLPKPIADLIAKIETHSYHAYAVGTCVFSLLRGETPQEYDIVANADYNRLLAIFDDNSPRFYSDSCDKKRGEITVRVKGAVVTVSPYRKGFDKDGHAVYSDALRDELARREFTFQAIAYNPDKGFKDPYHGGLCIHNVPPPDYAPDPDDLDNVFEPWVEVCAIGEDGFGLDDKQRIAEKIPDHAFERNPLAILSSLRYAAKGGFKISEATGKAVFGYLQLLTDKVNVGLTVPEKQVVWEAITDIITGRKAAAVVSECRNVIAAVIPEFEAITEFQTRDGVYAEDLTTHTAAALSAAAPDKILRLALFFSKLGYPDTFAICGGHPEEISYFGAEERAKIYAARIMRRFGAEKLYARYSLEEMYELITQNGCRELFANLRVPSKSIKKSDFRANVKRLFKKYSADELRLRARYCCAEEKAKGDETAYNVYKRILDETDDIMRSGECYNRQMLVVGIPDILARGLAISDAQADIVLDWLLDLVLETPALNVRSRLLQIAERTIRANTAAQSLEFRPDMKYTQPLDTP
ncbi:MAG: hypothetical protein LBN42_01015 [Oscillospiraceae bacterium]|jgi:tRNA nucleotidyltransferase (CCA-adding enzyme)|nr:hypothetical protein [Oscillospiraceae bacterium]